MRSLLFVGLLVVAACAKDTTSPKVPVLLRGDWIASLTGSFAKGGSAGMTLQLWQNGDTVTGTGVLNDPTDPPEENITVTGAVNGSNVQLTIQVQPQQYLGNTIDANTPPASFSGALIGSAISGTLTIGDTGKQVTIPANFVYLVPR